MWSLPYQLGQHLPLCHHLLQIPHSYVLIFTPFCRNVLGCAIVMKIVTVVVHDDTTIHLLAFGDLFEYLVNSCGRYPYWSSHVRPTPQNYDNAQRRSPRISWIILWAADDDRSNGMRWYYYRLFRPQLDFSRWQLINLWQGSKMFLSNRRTWLFRITMVTFVRFKVCPMVIGISCRS
jgi:hypothetical protein